MDARAKTVREILHSGDQYLIPFFQRYYSWKPKQWEQLRKDLWALVEADDESQHFMGPLVCTPTKHVPSEVPAYQLIDGQQRLTTLTVALAALRDVATERGEVEVASKIARNFLLHEDEEGLQRYKVLPRLGDREALIAILESTGEREFPDSTVDDAWRFFRGVFSRWTLTDTKSMLQKLVKVLTARLSLVVITIDGENPYEIFESLNSTGLPLEEADLIRNYLFMQIPLTEQDKFHRQHWQDFEKLFDRSGEYLKIAATPFYRNYLMRTGNYSKAGSTFMDFKAQSKEAALPPAEQVAELRRFAGYELLLQRPGTCVSAPLRRVLEQIQMLEVTTAHPLVMNLFERHGQGQFDEATLVACLDDLASFIIRRSICGESTRTYARWFPESIREIKNKPRDDLQQYWLRRGWPNDEAFTSRLVEFEIYRRELKKARVILDSLERAHKHKEPVDLTETTIEHVMPQGIDDDARGKAWRGMLGENWQGVHERWLHTLGNLTLTGYNSDMSNRPYAEKRLALDNSHVELNRHFTKVEIWNEETIKARGEMLAGEVARLWPRPAGEYIPTRDAQKRIPAGPERRRRFWTELVDLIRERKLKLETEEINGAMTLYYRCKVPQVKLWIYIARKHHEMQVGFTFRGKLGRGICERLKQEAAILESECGVPLRWTDSSTPMLYAYLPEARLKDLDDWPMQQAWMVDRLAAFLRVIMPRMEQLAGELPCDPATETEELRLAFWTAFRDYMIQRQSTLRTQKPSSQHWLTLRIGFSSIKLLAIASTWDSAAQSYDSHELRAELALEGKKAKARFAQIVKHRDDIEQEFGETLTWYNPEQAMNCRIYARLAANLLDRDQWPNYFEWLANKLEAMQQVFVPRLNALREATASERADESLA